MIGTGATFRVFDGTAIRDERRARATCLKRAVTDLAPLRPLLVIERDESLVRADQRALSDELHRRSLVGLVQHHHIPKRNDPGLWLADAAAWCWTHPQWRRLLPEVAVVDVAREP